MVAGGKQATAPYEEWISADPFNGGFRVLITGAGVIRELSFGRKDDPVLTILRRVVRESRAVEKRQGISIRIQLG